MHTQTASPRRVYLSPPHLTGLEKEFLAEALESNWIAPLGPQLEAFECEFAEVVGSSYTLALSSGTAALHLALLVLGVRPGDEVLVSTLSFCASANPIVYVGATPTFIDSERRSWNMDPNLLEQTLVRRARFGRIPKAVVVVHLYGQSCDLDPIMEVCSRFGVAVVEDAAEALGATYKGRAPGALGDVGIFSFNGNKIITTSGGGMLVSEDASLVVHARKLSTQAREAASHYEHSETGYNYRMSNLLAAVGRGQLRALDERVLARRHNFRRYRDELGDLPGISFMPEAPWGRHSRWLTCLTIDPAAFGTDREVVRLMLERENIEARPVWKPMHLQPLFYGRDCIGGSVSEELFELGLCLPSGSSLEVEDLSRVVAVIRGVSEAAHAGRAAQLAAKAAPVAAVG